jgi:glutathione S-transferase
VSHIKLYSYDACPFAQRTRMVLAEKNIDFDLLEVDVHNKPANWQEISPYGKVPVLRHGDTSVYESTIVNEYLDEVFPEPPLMPDGAAARAQARIWMDYCETRFRPLTTALVWEREDPKKLASNIEKLTEVLHFIEHAGLRKLSDGPYWFGQQVSLVDFQYLPFFERFVLYKHLTGFDWPADCSRLRAWFNTMSKSDSVRPTLRSLEFHLEKHQQLEAAIAARRSASS